MARTTVGDAPDNDEPEQHPERNVIDRQDGNIKHDPSDGLTAVERARMFSGHDNEAALAKGLGGKSASPSKPAKREDA